MKFNLKKYIQSKPIFMVGLFLCLMTLPAAELSAAQPVKTLEYEIVKVRDHYIDSYTQGLFFDGGYLYESNGQYGSSSFLKLDAATGEMISRVDYDSEFFVEGSCAFGDFFYVLTWMENVCFVYDRATMSEVAQLYNPRQGWGLTTDGKSLIMSDGGTHLFFLDPSTFYEQKSVEVTLDGKPLSLLNELEYIDGKVWANVYTKNLIVIIDPATGKVEAKLDLSDLEAQVTARNADVLNGIAYDKASGRILVTGKLWGKMFEIRLK